jgi:uncharacterized protein with HEPN domain
MSSRGVRLYLADIIDAIERIQHYTRGTSAQDFVRDGKTVDAVLRNISVIGEAAANIPEELKVAHPEIPWKEMIGMRNKVIHEYFGVDGEILWKTVSDDLVCLEKEVRSLLQKIVPRS